MNKYYRLLDKILASGKTQTGRKGTSRYLLNESLSLTPSDLLDIFEGHNIARRKLRDELRLFMNGERSVEKYREAGISWWDYCGHTLVNIYLLREAAATHRQNQPGEAQQQELCALPRLHRCGDQSSAVPQPRAIPSRRRRAGGVGLPAQFRRQPRVALRHLSPLPDGPANRFAPAIDYPQPR